jgi:hypothetical protein
MADEHVLHLAAAIDEHRIGMGFQELVRGLGIEMFHDAQSYPRGVEFAP